VLHEQLALVGREHARQALGEARQRHDCAGVERPRTDAAAMAHQRAGGRKPAAAGGRCQAGALERARERFEIVCGGVVDLDLAGAQEIAQLREIAAVGGDRVPGSSALERQMGEEIRDRIHAEPFADRRRYPPTDAGRGMSTHAGGSRTEPVDCIVWIDGEPFAIRVSPGVHTPSPFTQALVAALPRVDGLSVIDAGCGAGSVTVALLRRGAAHVSAWDIVPAAIDDTLENVARHADPSRLSTHLGSFDQLADVPADLLVTNPPQRPRAVWKHLPADARGIGAGGEDGLEALETILAKTAAPRVITSISTLTAPDLTPVARRHGFARAVVLADEPIAHDPIWRHAGSLADARVRVWELRRT
jgi:precorrin-6B methylase 2